MGAEVSCAGSEIMTQMHENFALPFDAVYVLVIRRFSVHKIHIEDHKIVLLYYHRSEFVTLPPTRNC